MDNNDFSALLAAAPDAKPSADSGKGGAAESAGAQDFSMLLASAPDAKPVARGGNVESFVREYAPLAARVSASTGVAPEALLGQWGLETGWGKSVIPGTNNLGNIKDFSGNGTSARDNMTGSNDKYRNYGNVEEFGDEFARLLGRRYKSALGSGSDAERYFSALKAGGYAEDPDYVRKGVAATSAAALALGKGAPSGGNFSDTRSEPVPERSFGQAISDVALGGAAGVVQGVGLIANAAGADNDFARGANDLSQSLMDMQSPQRKAERANRAELINQAEQSGSTWEEIKANVGAFLEAPIETSINALGTSAPTILMSFIPGLGQANAARMILMGAAGAAQGVGSVKGTIYQTVKDKVAADLVAGGMDEQRAAEEAEKVAVGAQAYDGQNGGQLAAGAILGVLAGTTGIEGAVSRTAIGQTMDKSILGRMALGAVTESIPEGAQGGQERLAANVALQNEGFDVPTWQGVAGQAAGEGIASMGPGAAFGALPPGHGIDPVFRPAMEKAKEPNSPLSKAAVAGAPAMQAQQEAEALDQAEANQKPVDPISERVRQIEDEVRANGVLDTLRTIGQRGLTEKEFLEALSIARNTQLDEKSPLIRQRALESLEEAMGWAREGSMPGIRLSDSTDLVTTPESKQPGTDLEPIGPRDVGPVGAGQFFDPNSVDVDATRVDNMLPGPRAIEGPRPATGMDEQLARDAEDVGAAADRAADAATQVDDDGQQGQSQEISAPAVADSSSSSRALSVDEATQGMPRVQIPQATDQEKGEAATAQRRKRKAQISQLAEAGYDTVERVDSGFEMVNSKTGARVVLDGMADAQIARGAIKARVDGLAHTAAASPLNSRLEPTEAQIKAGNYKKSDVIDLNGVKVKIENPAGSVRRGIGADGKAWETQMAHHYGEIQGTEGADGDKVDVFIGNRPDSNKVFVIDQVNPDGTFDEHKLVFGALNEQDARQTYLANYDKGWTGLGAIKEIPQSDLKQWLRDNAKKPAAESDVGAIKVTSEGKTYTISSVPVDSLPETAADSPARGDGGKRITKGQALLLKGLANFFGKDVVFFSDPGKKINSDGFVQPNDDVTIYINEKSGISPLAVFGHELMHLIKRDNPAAYAAIEKVVRTRVADPKGFRADYNATTKENVEDGDLSGAELEELISDLNGDLMSDSAFWRDVFSQIEADNGQAAKGIIAQLAAFLRRMIDEAVAAIKGQPSFRANRFISDMDGIRSAFRDGLAQYVANNKGGITQAAIQAEILRAQQKVGDVKRSAKRPEDGLTVDGYHFSKQPRKILSTGFFGTGLRGSDRDEIMANQDVRLRSRLSFYVNKGTGIRPEAGVGSIAHKATLTNIYDADADTRRLKQGRDKRAFETAVLNSGYSGYLSRMDGSQPGQVILLGNQSIEPEILGMRTQINDAKQVPAMAKREPDLGDRIEALSIPLNGQLEPSRWAQLIMARDPELAAQLLDLGVLSGSKAIYKDELAAAARGVKSQIKKSAKRAADEYAEVESKYKDTDQWLKAPNGNKTNLTERQWVHVRTPAFKAWFGDWEAANKLGGVWANDTVSKVVDENGEPLVVYHGTDKGGFMSFEAPNGTKRGDLGIFATDNWDMARSYVRNNSAAEVEARDEKAAAEAAGVEFYVYQGRTSSKQTEDQQLFGYRTPYGDEVDGYKSEEDAVYDAFAEYVGGDGAGEQPGVYALFLNIRNPSESDFEGAYWNGERREQYIVVDEDGEQIYDDQGRGYFDRDTADLLAQEKGGNVEDAPEHYESTDYVVKNAWLYKNDGAIIRNVVDDGGGPGGYYGEPADIFVALKPEQIKSADFNSGEYSPSTDDIRFSKKRAQDPADGDKTDISKLNTGRAIPESAAVGSLEKSLELARSKSYRRGRDLKKDIQDQVIAAAKAARVNLTERTKSTFSFLSRMVYDDAKFALQSNENAVGWYDQKVSRAIGALSTIHPEINNDKRSRLAFLWALATTSNGLKVDKNFELAEAAYKSWKTTGKMPTNIGIGNAAQSINKGMAAYNELAGKVGEERLLKFMGTKFEVGQIERMLDMKVGGEWKNTPVRGAAILGPKIGNGFFSNLNGYFDALTMDRWLMRTWGRMTGTLLQVTKQDIDASRKKLANKIGELSDQERRTMAKLIGHPVKKSMTKAELDAAAKASQKASMKKEKRSVMMSTDAMNEFRKAANLHHMTMDGQKEAPSGPAERNWIRAVFQDSLAKLQADGLNMTMSDLQALLWYPERRLYDAAKSDEDVANGYEDDEAPDYANAALNLAVAQGVDRDKVLAAMDKAEKRGTVQGEQLTDEEKAEMLEQFRSAPPQPMQIVFEVAPDPDNAELTAKWNGLTQKQKEDITEAVRDALVADMAKSMGLTGKIVRSMGGYEGQVNPNLVLEIKKKELTDKQARAFASALGIALDQKSMVVMDGRGDSSVGIVRVKLSEKAEKHAEEVMRLVGAAFPGVDGFSARGNNIDILNFTGMSNEELHSKIIDALEDFDPDVDTIVTYGEVKSDLIGKESYDSEIRGLGQEPGQFLLERARATRDRARQFLEQELQRAAVEVPGRAAGARRGDAGRAAAAAGRAEAGAVQDAGGIRRSAGRLAVEGGPDQGNGREADGSLKGLPRDFNVGGIDIRASHWAPAEKVAREYMKRAGLEYQPPAQYAKVNKERAARIAAEYDRMKHDPKNPVVRAAYQALAKETIEQYRAVIDSGLKVEFIDFAATGDPYSASPRLMTEDVRNNNHMWVFSTRDGFGTDASFDPEDNPLLAETEFEISGQKALVNDLFRVVHDYFGHVKEGVGFRADGEENTWRAHSSMFSPLAQRALTTETRGQNSWVNFGPHGEKNRTASAGDTHFADQKTGLLPLWASEEGRYDEEIKASKAREPIAPDFVVEDERGKNILFAEFEDGAAYVQFVGGKDGKVHVLSINAEESKTVRGRDILRWLSETYSKPVVANEVAPDARGYWNLMEDEGLIEGWSDGEFKGKTIPLTDTGIAKSAKREPEKRDEVAADEARGRRVSYEVTIEETGDTASMTVDAGQAIADYDDRISTMKKLLECLSK